MYATLKGQSYEKKFSLKKDLIELFFDSLRVQDVSLEQRCPTKFSLSPQMWRQCDDKAFAVTTFVVN